MDKDELAKWKKAGQITSECREFGRKLIKPGASMIEVCDKIEAKIAALGAKPAFPAQISLNSIAAHFCAEPNDNPIFKEGDVAKLDLGVHVDGFIGDTACTIDLGDNKELIKASEDALKVALSMATPGTQTGEIGRAIQEAITSYEGVSPIKNLGGHGLGEFMVHTDPHIPNIDTGNKKELEENMVIAIEPFATLGEGMVGESEHGNIFSLVNKKPVRNPYVRKILKFIEKEYNTLPFTTRWLTKKFSAFKVKLALNQLEREDILKCYPPLTDRGKGLVSQAEHSLIVKDKPIVLTK